ncbi:MAG: D-alanyl-D-alanine carboxypeptidase family protein [Hyphomicrobiales bacterium]
MLRHFFKLTTYLASVVLVALSVLPASAQLYQSRAEQAILIDMETGSILFQKDAERAAPPASLTKTMTSAIVFDAIRSGEISLETEFKVSEYAWRTGGAPARGSTMFAELGSNISVEDLLRGMIIQSGNDSAIILAEGLSGDVEAFAKRMNDFGKKLKLQDSNFANPNGLPHPDQRVSPRDLAKIAQYIIEEHPELYKIFAEREFKWNGIRQSNRNPLLSAPIGADGMKTGFSEEAGYGLVGSAIQDGRRLIAVLMGLRKESDRALDGRRLLEWGFTAFDVVEVFTKDTTIGGVRIYGSSIGRIGVKVNEPVVALMPKQSKEALEGRIVYRGPISLPVKEGDELAELHIFSGNRLVVTAPLYAVESVEPGGVLSRAIDGVGEFLFGWL